MPAPPYLPYILYSTALISVSIHLLWQRKAAEEDRARHDAQISILEDLAQRLRSGAPMTDEEVNGLRHLARIHGEGEAPQKRTGSEGGVRWTDAIRGRKVVNSDKSTNAEWEQKDLEQVRTELEKERRH
ncbi:hypothetical protein F5I97DRAFT_219098 [Phlebopus sp. FC_14]|nr:hypothetical protein F5I97DRAFT_219098 [Phlebopus sp. FC_14]